MNRKIKARLLKLKPHALTLYRFALLVGIVLLVRDHHVRLRISGDDPLRLEEVSDLYPGAERLRPDHSEKRGMFVIGSGGGQLGYVIRTAPHANHLTGYAGPTDVLIAFDDSLEVLGIRIRSSEDTHTHVGDVKTDEYFMTLFNDMSWDKLARLDFFEDQIEGVSGSTMTSMTMAEGIRYRIRKANRELAAERPIRFRWSDLGMLSVICGAATLSFSRLRSRRHVRRGFQVIVVLYVGFLTGNMIAQSLLAGWAKSAIPWQVAPGLVLLAAASLLVPATTHKPIYCHQLCPHGALQEWIGRVAPSRWKVHLPTPLSRSLKWLPASLLAGIIIAIMLNAPLDLADVEPFDAYLLGAAGTATITIAIIGLVAAAFIPQAYCRFGCPTGELLEFVRSHGRSDRFGRRDVAGALLLLLTALLYSQYDAINLWLLGTAAP